MSMPSMAQTHSFNTDVGLPWGMLRKRQLSGVFLMTFDPLQDFRAEHRKLMQEIETLKVSLEEETRHAGRMSKEVETWRQEYLNIKQQVSAVIKIWAF